MSATNSDNTFWDKYNYCCTYFVITPQTPRVGTGKNETFLFDMCGRHPTKSQST